MLSEELHTGCRRGLYISSIDLTSLDYEPLRVDLEKLKRANILKNVIFTSQ